MSETHKITHINDTNANLVSRLGNAQDAIQTDTGAKNLVFKDGSGNYHITADQKGTGVTGNNTFGATTTDTIEVINNTTLDADVILKNTVDHTIKVDDAISTGIANGAHLTIQGASGVHASGEGSSIGGDISIIPGSGDVSGVINLGNNSPIAGSSIINCKWPVDTIKVNTNIYTAAWQEHTPSYTGWAATPTRRCAYKTIGKLLFYNFMITGTGSGTTATLTLPAPFTSSTIPTGGVFQVNISTLDDTTANIGYAYVAVNSSSLILYKDINATNWTDNKSRNVTGQIWLEIQ
jgi:hypothetical protein